jgi:hypothetical protein
MTTTIAQLAQANYSSILQLLIDCEKPVRISNGDPAHSLVNCLVAVGLVDYLKSGWYRTSEKGVRFAAGSVCVGGFKLALQHVTEQVIAKNNIMTRPMGLRAKQKREADHLLSAAKILARINARDEQESIGGVKYS